MAEPWTEAWQEANTTMPPDVELIPTVELIHPAFGSDSIRAVAGYATDQSLTLEIGAPLNSGATVVFKAIPFKAEMPTFEEGKIPEIKITIDNVARELIPYLGSAVRMRADMLMLYREWRSDDLTSPCYGPTQFVLKRVTVNRTSVSGVARIDDLNNQKFPRLVYTLDKFPGLQS